MASFQSLLSVVKATPHRLYPLIDEYDNFANEILMGGQLPSRPRYEGLLQGEGALKAVFKTVKAAASGWGLDRVFIAGVAPIVLSDMTGGYNVAENIYLRRPFHDLCGFAEAEVSQALAAVVADCGLPAGEAEWEYACRAGTTTPFVFGETITSKLANVGNYPGGSGLIAEYPNGTTPVGYFGVANAFGLYDMRGNVWEWLLDAYHASYRGALVDGSAWDSHVDASRVMRGGSWSNPDQDSRSARRVKWEVPDFKGATHGFRVAMSEARPPRSRTTIK